MGKERLKFINIGQCIRANFFQNQMKKSPVMNFDDLKNQLAEVEKQCIVCPSTFKGPGDFCSQQCMYEQFRNDDLIQREDETSEEGK